MKDKRYKPVYGFGWFLSDSTPIGVPEEFTLSTAEQNGETLIGIVNPPRSLAGKQVEITMRTKGEEGNTYNVRIFNKKGQVELTGYAQ